LPGVLIVPDDFLDGLIESDQEGDIAADDLSQNPLGGAYLLLPALIGDKPGQWWPPGSPQGALLNLHARM